MRQDSPRENYHCYWGKSADQGYHLLAYHGVDVCSVIQSWIDCNRSFVNGLAARSAISFPTLRGLLRFFGSLHDAGKFSVTFQNLRPDLLRKLQGRESGKNLGHHRQPSNDRSSGLDAELISGAVLEFRLLNGGPGVKVRVPSERGDEKSGAYHAS